jgi:hypothetical protein
MQGMREPYARDACCCVLVFMCCAAHVLRIYQYHSMTQPTLRTVQLGHGVQDATQAPAMSCMHGLDLILAKACRSNTSTKSPTRHHHLNAGDPALAPYSCPKCAVHDETASEITSADTE